MTIAHGLWGVLGSVIVSTPRRLWYDLLIRSRAKFQHEVGT